MSGLTPERIDDAVNVLLEVFVPFAKSSSIASVLQDLRTEATRMRQERDAEAKREKRIGELADELVEMTSGWEPLPAVSHMRSMKGLAVQLVDRYPALAVGPAE